MGGCVLSGTLVCFYANLDNFLLPQNSTSISDLPVTRSEEIVKIIENVSNRNNLMEYLVIRMVPSSFHDFENSVEVSRIKVCELSFKK